MSKSRIRHIAVTTTIVVAIIAWSIFLVTVGAGRIVDSIGIENGYLFMFLVSLFGGVSSVGGAIYVTTIITLASAGLNPLYLALASGGGVSIGDSVYYYLGHRGSHLLPTKGVLVSKIHRFSNWLTHQARWLRAAAIYGYTSFTPLPNDVLTILLGVTRQPYVLVIPALVLGNITHTFLIATFGGWLPF